MLLSLTRGLRAARGRPLGRFLIGGADECSRRYLGRLPLPFGNVIKHPGPWTHGCVARRMCDSQVRGRSDLYRCYQRAFEGKRSFANAALKSNQGEPGNVLAEANADRNWTTACVALSHASSAAPLM